MADIELIIKIPEVQKQMVDALMKLPPQVENDLISAIRHGIPLPKGHGRLVDADAVVKKMEEREEKLKDDRSMWETAGVVTALDMFGETIIEADKESEDKK